MTAMTRDEAIQVFAALQIQITSLATARRDDRDEANALDVFVTHEAEYVADHEERISKLEDYIILLC